jgi:hypothetical protein
VGDRSPVHTDVIIITEIQEPFSGELSAVIDNDGVKDSEAKNEVLDEIYGLLGADFGQGLWLDPLCKFIHGDEQVR